MNVCRQKGNKNISIEKSQSPRGGRLCENGNYSTTFAYTNGLIAHQTSLYNYYSFGMPKPNHTIGTLASATNWLDEQDNNYRFGFNGQEKVNEIAGTGNNYDFGARIYSSRLGRFLSVDPKTSELSSQSPYVFANNSPIFMIDRKGMNGKVSIVPNQNGHGGVITISTVVYVKSKVNETQEAATKMNEYLEANKGAMTGTYIDCNNDVWKINLEVVYKPFQEGQLIENGDNVLNLRDPKTEDNSGRTPDAGYLKIGTIQTAPPTERMPLGSSVEMIRKFTGSEMNVGKYVGNTKLNRNVKFHELLHTFGLSERYKWASITNLPRKDVMFYGDEILYIDQVHWNNWGRAIVDMYNNFDEYNSDPNNNVNGTSNTNFILNWFVDNNGWYPFGAYDNNGNLIDKKANIGCDEP